MQQENDYIEREIQKMNLFLRALITQLIGLNTNDSIGIQQTEEALKSEFDLTLIGMMEMSNEDLLNRIKNLHNSHLEKIVELITEVVKKNEIKISNKNYKKDVLVKKGIFIINYLNENSDTFSMKRMMQKKALEDRLAQIMVYQERNYLSR